MKTSVKRMIAAAILATTVVGGTAAPAFAGVTPKLPGCEGKWRVQADSWYETGYAIWNTSASTQDSGYFGGKQLIGYYYCPDEGDPAWIAPAWNYHGWRAVDKNVWPYFLGISNRSWLYDDAGKNWNMPWDRVKSADDMTHRYDYYDAPGNQGGDLVRMKVKDDPRWKAEMQGHIVSGGDPYYDYLTASGGTVNYILVDDAEWIGPWKYPGQTTTDRETPGGMKARLLNGL